MIAGGAGGRVYSPARIGYLPSVLSGIADDLSFQYHLACKASQDGAWRSLRVRIRDRPGAVACTRKGCTSPMGVVDAPTAERLGCRNADGCIFEVKVNALFQPAYLALDGALLRQRVDRAVAGLADCRACPRDCRVNRLEGKWAACKTGRYAVVSSCFAHFGEEDCLRGWNGSGTIFFSHCNLRCVFCQNFDISQAIRPGAEGPGTPPETIAAWMLELQRRGCHNINLVTPEHVVPQVIEAVAKAIGLGLRAPIVYNTSGYDSLESIELMDGIVDIYMPDFKYWSPERSRKYLKAENYPASARAAILEMHRQVGPLVLDSDGLARRGVLLRHLVMPGFLDETRAILEWIASELGTDTYVNLMDQYSPAGRVNRSNYPEINRGLKRTEFLQAQYLAMELGLRRLDTRRAHPRLASRLL